MPYIKKEDRKLIEPELNALIEKLIHYNMLDNISREGMLNYIFTTLLLDTHMKKELKYSDYNADIGILECCKLEHYRMQVSDYEDLKMQDNGAIRRCY